MLPLNHDISIPIGNKEKPMNTDEQLKYYQWLYKMGLNETLNMFNAPLRAEIDLYIFCNEHIDYNIRGWSK